MTAWSSLATSHKSSGRAQGLLDPRHLAQTPFDAGPSGRSALGVEWPPPCGPSSFIPAAASSPDNYGDHLRCERSCSAVLGLYGATGDPRMTTLIGEALTASQAEDQGADVQTTYVRAPAWRSIRACLRRGSEPWILPHLAFPSIHHPGIG